MYYALTIWIPYIFDFHFVTSRNIISFKEYNHGKKSLLEAILFCFFDVHISMKDAKRVLVFFGTKNEITFFEKDYYKYVFLWNFLDMNNIFSFISPDITWNDHNRKLQVIKIVSVINIDDCDASLNLYLFNGHHYSTKYTKCHLKVSGFYFHWKYLR